MWGFTSTIIMENAILSRLWFLPIGVLDVMFCLLALPVPRIMLLERGRLEHVLFSKDLDRTRILLNEWRMMNTLFVLAASRNFKAKHSSMHISAAKIGRAHV